MGPSTAVSQYALVDFLGRCDPAAPAEPSLYVARPKPFAPWLSQTLSHVPTAKVLLMGQAGVGKSTELARLGDSLDSRFTIIRPPIEQVLDLSIAGWHDILVFSAVWHAKPSERRDARTYHHLSKLENELLKGLGKPGAPEATAVQAFRNDPRSVHTRIEAGRAQFWDLSLDVIKKAGGESDRPVVLILDGLEKLPANAMARLFQEERRYIMELPLRTVVTAPLGMSFLSYFAEVESEFLAVTRLRALSHQKGEPGAAFLRELAVKRGALQVIEEPLLEDMLSWSGGLPRQLLQLLTASATQALTDGLSRVEKEAFVRARRRVTERWQYQLEPTDYDSLQKADEERTTTQRSRLLSLGALLEYDQPDGGLGIGVNPLVGVLLKQRKFSGS